MGEQQNSTVAPERTLEILSDCVGTVYHPGRVGGRRLALQDWYGTPLLWIRPDGRGEHLWYELDLSDWAYGQRRMIEQLCRQIEAVL